MEQKKTYTDSLLLTNLSSDMGTGPQVDEGEEGGECTDAAAISNSLSILPNNVASAEVSDDT